MSRIDQFIPHLVVSDGVAALKFYQEVFGAKSGDVLRLIVGEGAKMAVTGDPTQVDLVNPHDSGLSHAISILEGVEGVAIARFEASDVVRHPLVERIVNAYDADAAQRRR